MKVSLANKNLVGFGTARDSNENSNGFAVVDCRFNNFCSGQDCLDVQKFAVVVGKMAGKIMQADNEKILEL